MSKIKYVPGKKVLALAIASAALAGCNSDSDDAPQILLSGGNAGSQLSYDGYSDWNSVGGDGGSITLYKQTGGGDIRILRSGSVNAKFDRSGVDIDTDLGENPLQITGNRTIGPAAVEPAAGTAYLGPEERIFISDGNGTLGDEPEVTGLRVAAGATLTLVPNVNMRGSEASDDETAALYVRVLDNRGTITVVASEDGAETGSLSVYAQTLISSGTIDLRGADNAESQTRRDGGHLFVQADEVFIDGRVLASGGTVAGDNVAGHGGSAYLYSEGGQHHRGSFKLDGGAAVNGEGGQGGSVMLISDGPAYNEARISLQGGNGEVGGQGGGAFIGGYGGDAWNAGAVVANGGSGSAGHGGDGGYLNIYAYGGELRNSGSLTARGGAGGAQPVFGPEGGLVDQVGSEGGSIYARSNWRYGDVVAAGNLAWSGNIDLRGGSAPAGSERWGGEGGSISIGAENWGISGSFDAAELVSTVSLYGYGSLVGHGGDGHVAGDAGSLSATNYSFSFTNDSVPSEGLGGGIDASLNVAARGGKALAGGISERGSAGDGGSVLLQTYFYNFAVALVGEDNVRAVRYTGNLDVPGGSGRDWNDGHSGQGGYLYVAGHDAVTITSALNAPGANDAGTTGIGGTGGGVYAESWLDDMVARVALAGNGGNGGARGGDGGYFYVYGEAVDHRGVISVKGGNANVAVEDSAGGPGGWIEIIGDISSAHSGSVNYAGGVGNAGTASEGCFVLGDDAQGNCDS